MQLKLPAGRPIARPCGCAMVASRLSDQRLSSGLPMKYKTLFAAAAPAMQAAPAHDWQSF
ncbi:hypothetical protein [uncultured Piscinibacter sp.]|uniref:hypothetical protein n=1 Tax=uncultured Piscinibacter sp. TaxID=1131835 RepID=UPI0026026C4A|nr:hypothetical protein [uncultured Piscinibacter sp.]